MRRLTVEGAYRVEANGNRTLGHIRISHADKRLLLMRWTDEIAGVQGANHYLLGFPAFSLEAYKGWLPAIAGLLGDFDSTGEGQ